MKKLFLITICILVLTTGCVNIQKASIDDLITTTVHSKYKLYNHVNRGYKYYLPRELISMKQDEYNEIIKSKYYDYYLYVDLVRYFNHAEESFEVNNGNYYSRLLQTEDKSGILNIKQVAEDEYLIQVNYNYANIEVRVREKDIHTSLVNALVIVSSISYNDAIIKSLLEQNTLTSPDEQVKVFDIDTTEDDLLDVEEDVYSGNEEEDYDPDVINKRG